MQIEATEMFARLVQANWMNVDALVEFFFGFDLSKSFEKKQIYYDAHSHNQSHQHKHKHTNIHTHTLKLEQMYLNWIDGKSRLEDIYKNK